jgi:hypothetical protein
MQSTYFVLWGAADRPTKDIYEGEVVGCWTESKGLRAGEEVCLMEGMVAPTSQPSHPRQDCGHL